MIKRIRLSKRARRRTPRDGSRAGSNANYKTGYGRPPKERQFKPGQSGNPKGRPKGVKNTMTLLREILDRKVEVRIGSTVRKISVREAILTRFAESALKGDTKSAGFLLQRYDTVETAQEHADSSATLEEQEIIDAYLQAHLNNGGKQK
jgi:hypothetical protein